MTKHEGQKRLEKLTRKLYKTLEPETIKDVVVIEDGIKRIIPGGTASPGMMHTKDSLIRRNFSEIAVLERLQRQGKISI